MCLPLVSGIQTGALTANGRKSFCKMRVQIDEYRVYVIALGCDLGDRLLPFNNGSFLFDCTGTLSLIARAKNQMLGGLLHGG